MTGAEALLLALIAFNVVASFFCDCSSICCSLASCLCPRSFEFRHCDTSQALIHAFRSQSSFAHSFTTSLSYHNGRLTYTRPSTHQSSERRHALPTLQANQPHLHLASVTAAVTSRVYDCCSRFKEHPPYLRTILHFYCNNLRKPQAWRTLRRALHFSHLLL